MVTLTASLTPLTGHATPLIRAEKLQVVQLSGVPVGHTVAVRESGDTIKRALGRMGVTPVAEGVAQCLVYSPEASP